VAAAHIGFEAYLCCAPRLLCNRTTLMAMGGSSSFVRGPQVPQRFGEGVAGGDRLARCRASHSAREAALLPRLWAQRASTSGMGQTGPRGHLPELLAPEYRQKSVP
jgi:hypothetical protein